MAFVTTFGFTQAPDKVGTVIANIGEGRTLGYAAHGTMGMITLFMRGMLCNWMVSTGVVGAMVSTTVPGKAKGPALFRTRPAMSGPVTRSPAWGRCVCAWRRGSGR
jgi:formate/nitrite transporter FocA (FNT family)